MSERSSIRPGKSGVAGALLAVLRLTRDRLDNRDRLRCGGHGHLSKIRDRGDLSLRDGLRPINRLGRRAGNSPQDSAGRKPTPHDTHRRLPALDGLGDYFRTSVGADGGRQSCVRLGGVEGCTVAACDGHGEEGAEAKDEPEDEHDGNRLVRSPGAALRPTSVSQPVETIVQAFDGLGDDLTHRNPQAYVGTDDIAGLRPPALWTQARGPDGRASSCQRAFAFRLHTRLWRRSQCRNCFRLGLYEAAGQGLEP